MSVSVKNSLATAPGRGLPVFSCQVLSTNQGILTAFHSQIHSVKLLKHSWNSRGMFYGKSSPWYWQLISDVLKLPPRQRYCLRRKSYSNQKQTILQATSRYSSLRDLRTYSILNTVIIQRTLMQNAINKRPQQRVQSLTHLRCLLANLVPCWSKVNNFWPQFTQNISVEVGRWVF